MVEGVSKRCGVEASSFLNPDCGCVSVSMSVVLVGASAPVFAACREDCERYRASKMNPATSRNPNRAFSVFELLVLLASLAVFILLALALNPGRRNTALGVCLSNLRQTSLGFAMWSEDNGGARPWQVSTNQGGTKELISKGRTADHFLALSNYQKVARVFFCPADPARQSANNYSNFGNSNLSYFLGLDAITNSGLAVLTGDRHLQLNRQPVTPGLLVVSNRAAFGWTKELHARTFQSAVGNLSFADGHVEHVRATRLSRYFQRSALVTNRLVIP